jgi:hypothetical protein
MTNFNFAVARYNSCEGGVDQRDVVRRDVSSLRQIERTTQLRERFFAPPVSDAALLLRAARTSAGQRICPWG